MKKENERKKEMKRKRIAEGAEDIFEGEKRKGFVLFKGQDISKIKRAAHVAKVFIVSLLLGMVRAPGGTYPLSIGALTAASGGIDTSVCFMGAVLATVAMDSGALAQVGALSGIMAIRFSLCLLKGDLKERDGAFRRIFRERGYIRIILAASGAAARGIYLIFNSHSIYYGLFSALLGMGEAALSAVSFLSLADVNADKSRRLAGLATLSAGLAASLSIFSLPFSLSTVAVFAASVYFSLAGGCAMGCITGLAGGLAVGIGYAPAFGAAAIVCSMLSSYSTAGAVISAGICAALMALFSQGMTALSDIIPELAFSVALTAPLLSLGLVPKSLPAFLDFSATSAVYQSPETSVKHNRKYAKIGEALSDLSSMLHSVGDKLCLPTKAEANRICISARAKHCSGCVHEKECGGRDDSAVSSMFSNMAYRLSTTGSVTAKIVPQIIARRCFNMDSILEYVNSCTRKISGLSSESRSCEMFASDYSAIADLIKELSGNEEAHHDTEGETDLARELSLRGFSFTQSSVYGKRAKSVYMRGIELMGMEMGEEDIRRCAEKVLGTRLSPPEFSLDGKYVSASMHSLPAIKLKGGRYSAKSGRDCQSGDSSCSFENGDGYFYTLVFDGMGSGREAALTSSISAAFLEKLLLAGCPMKSALELLNCFVRGSSGECFTTVDLMEADLYTKRARFIKSGAAPSFIVRRGQLYRLHSKTVPVGIMQTLDAESIAFDLMEGDRIIMMSDGVTGSYEDCPWLYELLGEGLLSIDSPTAAARYIGEAAVKNTGKDDDITVCVLEVTAA